MTSALTDSGNGKVVVRRGSIVVDSGNAAAIVVTGNGSVQAAQIDVAGGDRPSGNGKISGAVQTRHASLTGLLSSIHCALRSDTPKQFGAKHQTCLTWQFMYLPTAPWRWGRLKWVPRFAVP